MATRHSFTFTFTLPLPMLLAETIATELSLAPWQVARTLELFEEGNTLPIIARLNQPRPWLIITINEAC